MSVADEHSATRAKQGASARVQETIKRRVESGRYVPGQRLVEADLTRELGVSRGPVREAFKRLSGEGVLTLNRNRGAVIRAQSREEVRETLVVLESLTGLAAKLAARHIDEPGCRAQVAAALRRLQQYEHSGETLDFLRERRRFYDLLIEIGGNRELARLMPHMQISLLRLQFQAFITTTQHANQYQELCAIAEAVLAGDPKRAERATRLHLRRRRVSLTALPDEAYACASGGSEDA